MEPMSGPAKALSVKGINYGGDPYVRITVGLPDGSTMTINLNTEDSADRLIQSLAREADTAWGKKRGSRLVNRGNI